MANPKRQSAAHIEQQARRDDHVPKSLHAVPPPPAITTPDKLETVLGTFEFKDGAPSKETVKKVYDSLDLMHGVEAFINCFQGPSVYAARKGFQSIGADDNSVVIFSELMDSKSLFLTANADTVYFLGMIDLSKGPMVVETPPMALGIFDDVWFRWIIDFGLPGPDRGAGGKFLIVPNNYNGPLPDSGFHVGRSRTKRILMLGRSFMENSDPKPTVELIKKTLKIYPYTPGAFGTSIASALEAGGKLAANPEIPATRFVEASGKSFNTIPPTDFGYFEMLNDLVQEEPDDPLDPEIMGHLAAIGIVKGKPFTPDARMKKILTDAAAIATAMGRTLNWSFRDHEGWAYYPDSSWYSSLWEGGYLFESPPPLVTEEGIKPLPATGVRKLHSRFAFFYIATGITPAMIMRLTNVGSQYLMCCMDADKNYFDGAKTYKVRLPKGIPEARFWSFTLYDNQTRSMLETPQRYPRAGSQSYPTPAAEADADGSTTVYFGPTLSFGVKPGNWIQTVPGKGWFTLLRLYSPLQPFFDKTWRVGEIERVD